MQPNATQNVNIDRLPKLKGFTVQGYRLSQTISEVPVIYALNGIVGTSPPPRPPPRPTPPPPGPPSTSTPAPAPPPQTECPADVIFMLDGSESIGETNFDQMKMFLRQLVSRLDIDRGNTRVGLVTFSSGVGTTINLNAHSSVRSLQSAISLLRYPRGSTNTAVALAHVRTTMLTSAAGDRSDVSNVVVLLTDGGSDDPTATRVSSVAIEFIAC